MPLIDPARTRLLVIDIQVRLMPAIADGAGVIANTGRLLAAAGMLDVPSLFTEQNAGGLGPTVPDFAPEPGAAFAKMSFGAAQAPGFLDRIGDRDLVVTGCEAHICVLQTVLGLLEAGRRVYVVADAVGSRKTGNRDGRARPDGGPRRRDRHHRDGGVRVARHRPASALPRGRPADQVRRAQPPSSAARVLRVGADIVQVPSMPSASISRTRARLTRLLIVPTATPQIAAASS